MTKNKLLQNRFAILAFYVISLLPLWLPWFGFDPEIDGLRSGYATINHIVLAILTVATVICLLIARDGKLRVVTLALLLLHPVVYMFYFLFWYVRLITSFNIITSFETAHIGFYIAMILSIGVYMLYKKYKCEDVGCLKTHARASN